jgi:hypothetical protein
MVTFYLACTVYDIKIVTEMLKLKKAISDARKK